MKKPRPVLHLSHDEALAFGSMLPTVCGRWLKGVAQKKPRAIVWDCVGDWKLATCPECRARAQPSPDAL